VSLQDRSKQVAVPLGGSGDSELAVFTRPDACDHGCHLLYGGSDAGPAAGGEHQDGKRLGLEVLLIAKVDVGADDQAITQLTGPKEEILVCRTRPALLIGRAHPVGGQPMA